MTRSYFQTIQVKEDLEKIREKNIVALRNKG